MAIALSKQTVAADAGVSVLSATPAITVNASSNVLVLCIVLFNTAGTGAGPQCTPSGRAATWTKVADIASNNLGGRVQIFLGSGALSSGNLSLSFSISAEWAANISEWSGLSTTVDSAISWGLTNWTGTGSIGYSATSGTANQTISAPTADSLILHAAMPFNAVTSFTYTSPTTAQTSLTGKSDLDAANVAAAYAVWGSTGTYSLGVPTGSSAANDGWVAVAIRPFFAPPPDSCGLLAA